MVCCLLEQKRPIIEAKETYYRGKRDLLSTHIGRPRAWYGTAAGGKYHNASQIDRQTDTLLGFGLLGLGFLKATGIILHGFRVEGLGLGRV